MEKEEWNKERRKKGRFGVRGGIPEGKGGEGRME